MSEGLDEMQGTGETSPEEALSREVATIEFVPNLVPGFADRTISINGQELLVHEVSNFPILLAVARKYKKAREADDPSKAIEELRKSLDPLQSLKLQDLIEHQAIIDEFFVAFAAKYPNLYRKIAEYSVMVDTVIEGRKQMRAGMMERTEAGRQTVPEIPEEENLKIKYYFSASLDGAVSVMRDIGQPERLYDLINFLVR